MKLDFIGKSYYSIVGFLRKLKPKRRIKFSWRSPVIMSRSSYEKLWGLIKEFSDRNEKLLEYLFKLESILDRLVEVSEITLKENEELRETIEKLNIGV